MNLRATHPRLPALAPTCRRRLLVLLLLASGAAGMARQAFGQHAFETAAFGGGRALAAAPRAALQQATATVTPTLAPLPELAGVWSITRGWQRRCPGCSSPTLLTSRWVIEQSGSELHMAQGPRGNLTRDGAGRARLTLEGLEQAGPSTLRFYYASLLVAEDGSGFEGSFNGSERIANPCGDSPPVVTCFSDGGWLRATRIEVGSATPTLAPTGTVTPPTGPTPVAATASPTGAASTTPLPSTTPAPSATPIPNATPIPSSTPGSSASPRPSETSVPLGRSKLYLPALQG